MKSTNTQFTDTIQFVMKWVVFFRISIILEVKWWTNTHTERQKYNESLKKKNSNVDLAHTHSLGSSDTDDEIVNKNIQWIRLSGILWIDWSEHELSEKKRTVCTVNVCAGWCTGAKLNDYLYDIHLMLVCV